MSPSRWSNEVFFFRRTVAGKPEIAFMRAALNFRQIYDSEIVTFLLFFMSLLWLLRVKINQTYGNLERKINNRGSFI